MTSFVKIEAEIFNRHLTPNELKVFCYLRSVSTAVNSVAVRVSVICQRCAIASATTVRAALRKLEAQGLLSVRHRHGRDGYYISNEIIMAPPRGRWFRLPLCAFSLPKSSFAVYALLAKQMDNAKQSAYPSYSKLAQTLSLARRTVIEAVRELVNSGIISKGRKWAGKHNIYFLLQYAAVRLSDTEKGGCPLQAAPKMKRTCFKDKTYRIVIIKPVQKFVKSICSHLICFCGEVVQKLIISYKTLLVKGCSAGFKYSREKRYYPTGSNSTRGNSACLSAVLPSHWQTRLSFSASRPKDISFSFFSMVKSVSGLYNRSSKKSNGEGDTSA